MPKTLAGILFVHNGISRDYTTKESIESLLEFCDHVFLLDAGSTDGTRDILSAFKKFKPDKVTAIYLSNEDWHSKHGKEKLSYFTNIAIERAESKGYDYVFNLQADEIVHERSYEYIRQAMEDDSEGFLVSRVNLWGSPYTKLIVPENRQPCSTVVCRLAKSNYRAYDDAESLNPQCVPDFIRQITIYHMGFVRDRKVMVEKIRHMQADVFGVNPDAKLEGMEVFQPWKWFDKSDVELINEPLPKIIQGWAKGRNCELPTHGRADGLGFGGHRLT